MVPSSRLLLAFLLVLLAGPSAVHADDEVLAHERFVLPNGLTVILRQDTRLPLVAVDVDYAVGARDDPRNLSGFAHLVEHLMFDGTARVPKGEYDRILEADGAWSNAWTDHDHTHFYVVGPARVVPTILWLEADRMRGIGDALTDEIFRLERDVVRNEIRESTENAPYGKASARLYAALFPNGHAYHRPVLGSHEDLGRATVADVRRFVQRYYVPNNARLSVVGDVDPKVLRPLITRLFSTVERADDPPRAPSLAPTAGAGAEITLVDEVRLPRTTLAWRTPAWGVAGDAEFDLLAEVLAGSRNGRLHRRLVHEERQAVQVAVWQTSMQLASVFQIEITGVEGASLDYLERAAMEELQQLFDTGPSAEELARAVARWEESTITSLQPVQTVAELLAFYDLHLGAPDRLAWDLARYREATPASARGALRRSLGGDRPPVVLRVLPEVSRASRPTLPATPPADLPERRFVPPVPEAFRLPNGLTVWHLDRPGTGLVSGRLILDAGSACDATPGRAGLASLSGAMLREGAGELDALAFATRLDEVAANLWVDTDVERTVVGLSSLARHADEGLRLLGLALRAPRFEADAWDLVTARHVTRVRRLADEPEALARRVAWAALLAPHHPASAMPSDGVPRSILAQSREAARRFSLTHHRPDRALLVVVGDLRGATVRTLVETHLGGWSRLADVPTTAPPQRAGSAALRVLLVDRPGAEQTVLRWAALAPAWNDEDRVAFDVLSSLFGGGASSRLYARLRERGGWTYGAYASYVPFGVAGTLSAYASVQTEVTEPALGAFLEEVRRLATGDASQAEVTSAVASLRAGTLQGFEDVAGSAGLYALHARHGGGPRGLARDAAALEAVTLDAVNAAARRHVRPDEGVLVLVGDAGILAPLCDRLGLPEPLVLTAAEAVDLEAVFGASR